MGGQLNLQLLFCVVGRLSAQDTDTAQMQFKARPASEYFFPDLMTDAATALQAQTICHLVVNTAVVDTEIEPIIKLSWILLIQCVCFI